jgi:hypothetical protein
MVSQFFVLNFHLETVQFITNLIYITVFAIPLNAVTNIILQLSAQFTFQSLWCH